MNPKLTENIFATVAVAISLTAVALIGCEAPTPPDQSNQANDSSSPAAAAPQ